MGGCNLGGTHGDVGGTGTDDIRAVSGQNGFCRSEFIQIGKDFTLRSILSRIASITRSASLTASFRSPVKEIRLRAFFAASSVSFPFATRPGRYESQNFPLFAALPGITSVHTVLKPLRAHCRAIWCPMFPAPITATFFSSSTFISCLPLLCFYSFVNSSQARQEK